MTCKLVTLVSILIVSCAHAGLSDWWSSGTNVGTSECNSACRAEVVEWHQLFQLGEDERLKSDQRRRDHGRRGGNIFQPATNPVITYEDFLAKKNALLTTGKHWIPKTPAVAAQLAKSAASERDVLLLRLQLLDATNSGGGGGHRGGASDAGCLPKSQLDLLEDRQKSMEDKIQRMENMVGSLVLALSGSNRGSNNSGSDSDTNGSAKATIDAPSAHYSAHHGVVKTP